MCRALLLLVAALNCSMALALGRVVPYAELPFSSVQHLQSCGAWSLGEHAGQFRILHLYLYGQDMLFVDMVRPNAEQTQLVVEQGFSVAEFNNDHADFTLSALRCEALARRHQLSTDHRAQLTWGLADHRATRRSAQLDAQAQLVEPV